LDRPRAFWNNYRRVIFKLLRDCIAPVLAALAWGSYVAIQKKSNVDGFNAASLAFFLILSFQNLIQRAAKVVHDIEHGEKLLSRFDALEQGFDTLQQGLGELRAQGLVPPAPSQDAPPMAGEPYAPPIKEPEPEFNEDQSKILLQWNPQEFAIAPMQPYLTEAHQAIKSGLYLAAALVAAVGFEAAVRETARMFRIPDKRISLATLLRELSAHTSDKRKIETLVTLNRIRNGLVHGERQTSHLTREEALELIDAFRVGANYLMYIPNDWTATSSH